MCRLKSDRIVTYNSAPASDGLLLAFPYDKKVVNEKTGECK